MVRFLAVRSPYEPEKRERGESIVREGAGGSWIAVARHFRDSGGVFKRERAFMRETSGERELGVQGLRVRSPLIKFLFHSEVSCPVEASPFVADPRILIVFLLFCFFFLPAASCGTERILGGGILVRHPSNIF